MAPSLKNKFGFRPPRSELASQVKPQALRSIGRSPKRPRDDVLITSAGKTSAKRVKPANKLFGAPVIEISDDEYSNTHEDGGNERTDTASIRPRSHSIPGSSSVSQIVDLTIESPSLESSPGSSTRSFADGQKKVEKPVMLGAEDMMIDNELQYQFAFQRSRGHPFPEVEAIKTEVEEQSPMAQRFRSMTLEVDHSEEASNFKSSAVGQGRRPAVTEAAHGAVATQIREESKETSLQRTGPPDVIGNLTKYEKGTFKILAKLGQPVALVTLPTVSNFQASPAAPPTPRLHTNARFSHTSVSPSTRRLSGSYHTSGSHDLGGISRSFVPAPSRGRGSRSRIPVPVRTQKSSSALNDHSMTSNAAVETTTKILAKSTFILPLASSSLVRNKDHWNKQATTVSPNRSIVLREREETPMERMMPRNVLTPIRTSHFDDLLDRVAENKRLGIQAKAKIFTQKISTPTVQETRLELFWITTMKLVGARQRFVRNHDRLSSLLHAVNKELGRQEPFSWDEGHDIARELQNQRKLTLTSSTNPRLFFTRDGQEVMGFRQPQ